MRCGSSRSGTLSFLRLLLGFGLGFARRFQTLRFKSLLTAALHGGTGDLFINDKLQHRHAVGLAEFEGGMDTFDGVHMFGLF